jgi:hypothetical protein
MDRVFNHEFKRVWTDLTAYLISHEKEIANGENDFGELQSAFALFIGRYARGGE